MDDDFRERFLKGNANSRYMGHHLAELVRSLVRAMATNSDTSSQLFRASEILTTLIQLMSRADDLRPGEIVQEAAQDLAIEEPRDRVNEAILDAARMGTRYLVESSCADNAARGRSSKRREEFLTAIQWIEEAREERRRSSKWRL